MVGDLAHDRFGHSLHRDRQRVDRGAGDAVLPDLMCAVGQFDLYGNVLSGTEIRHGRAVGRCEEEGRGVVGFRIAAHDAVLPPDSTGRHSGVGVEPLLPGDEGVGHQPVHLVPRRGDLLGHRIAQNLRDRREEVGVHDPVLVPGHPERGVFVRDAVEHRLRKGVRLFHQRRGERRDGSRQGLLLLTDGLTTPVEQVAQQLRVGGEHLAVEDLGDLTDRSAHRGQGGTDDLGRLRGQHHRSPNWYSSFVFKGLMRPGSTTETPRRQPLRERRGSPNRTGPAGSATRSSIVSGSSAA